MKFLLFTFLTVFLFLSDAGAQITEILSEPDRSELLRQREDSFLVTREHYLTSLLDLSPAQAKQLRKLYQTFYDYRRRIRLMNDRNSGEPALQLIAQPDEEIKKILSEAQYRLLKTEQENIKRAVLEKYTSEQKKQQAALQKNKPDRD